eukprot:scaffold483739_cov134-Attheya_sp.AAC.1
MWRRVLLLSQPLRSGGCWGAPRGLGEDGGEVKREPRDDEEMVARVSLLIHWNVSATSRYSLGDSGCPAL